MRSLKLFGLTIALLLAAWICLPWSLMLTALLALAGLVTFFIALVVNHDEHTRR